MNHPQTHPHELISAMLDGEIDDRERAEVEAHLRGCPACRELAGDLAALGKVFAEDPVPPVPAGLASRIGWSLRARDVSRRRLAGIRWPGPRMLAALGGVAAALVLGVLFLREGEAPFHMNRIEDTTALKKETATEPDQGLKTGNGRVLGGEGSGAPATGSAQGDGGAPAAKLSADAIPAERDERLRSLGYAGSSGSDGSRALDHTATTQVQGADRQRPVVAGGTGRLGGIKPVAGGKGTGYAPVPAQRAPNLESPAPPPPLPPAVPMPGAAPRTDIADKKDSAKKIVEDNAKSKDSDTNVAMAKQTAAGPSGNVEGDVVARAIAGVDNDALAKLVIAPCPSPQSDKPVRRWIATTAPLPLRAARADAEPDLAGLAARLGGSLCAEPVTGASPLLVLEVPLARWSELRDAMTPRVESKTSFSTPPAQGIDVVRIVVRPK